MWVIGFAGNWILWVVGFAGNWILWVVGFAGNWILWVLGIKWKSNSMGGWGRTKMPSKTPHNIFFLE